MIIQRPDTRILTIGDMGAVEIVQRAPLGVALLPTANLIEHLDADAISGLNDGDGIATWTATVGTNATQATVIKRPIYKTGIQNGLPIVRTDGISDSMQLTGLTQASGSLTFIAAINPAATGTQKYLFDTQTGRLVITLYINVANRIGWFDAAWRNIAASAGNFQILSWVLTSGGNGEIFRNGASLGTAPYTARAIGGKIGLFSDFNYNSRFPLCDLGEFLIYSTALDVATRGQAETYLNSKWAAY